MNGFGKVIPPQILFFNCKVAVVLVEAKSYFKTFSDSFINLNK